MPSQRARPCFLRAGGGVSGRMGQAFCGSFVHLYVENGARRRREIRVDRILERNLGRGARSWPLSCRVAETAKRPMGSPYRRGLVSPLGQRNRAIGASIASLASPSCPTTVRLTRAYCFFSKGCFFKSCSKQRGRTYVESRCRQDVASYVSTMRSFGMQYPFQKPACRRYLP
jgi:hypothetical protein